MEEAKYLNILKILFRLFIALVVTCGLVMFCRWCTAAEGMEVYTHIGVFCSLLIGAIIALPVRLPKLVSGALFPILPIMAFYMMETLTHNPFEIRTTVVVLEFVFFYLLYTTLFFITGRMSVGFILGNLLVLVIGIANYYVLEFRSNPILPWDITSLGTAASVADNFVFNGSLTLMISVFGTVFASALAEKCTLKAPSLKPRLISVATCLVLFAGYIFGIQTDAAVDMFNIYEMPFTQGYTYRMNGFFVSFLVNAKYLKVEVPDGYSHKEADSLLENAGTPNAPGADTDRPNIIVVMNEAFSDLSVLGDFTTSMDYMPNLHALMESDNTVSGSLYVSVLGGNTANTEFEFLTGSTTGFLPTGSVAYQQFVKSKTPSLAWALKDYGYETVAMHPYGASGWNRDTVYPMLGFDRALFRPDFKSVSLVRGYVSDAANYRQLIKEFEAKKDGSPIFIFDVTMQNHGSYSKEYANFTPYISVNDTELGSFPKAETYLSLIHNADQALADLISYFESVNEKTLVVFFGDHQPTLLESAFFKTLFGKSTSQLNLEEMASRYKVPFLMWANYDLEKETDLTLSVNYLSSLVMDAAGLQKTEHQLFLDKMREVVPVVTANFYKDNAGNLYTTEAQSSASPFLLDYAKVQYSQLFDTKRVNWDRFLP